MTHTNITIRSATPADAPQLTIFQQAMAKETEGKTLDQMLLRKGIEAVFSSHAKGRYLVAEAKGTVIGGLLITYEWSDWRNGMFWWIQSVYVDPKWRRKGAYRAMHSHVRHLASQSGDVCGIRLYVERNNSAAQRTYATLGMTELPYDLYEMNI